MSIRIGLVGCGDIVKRYYLPALQNMQEQGKVRLAACCDLDAAKAKEALGTGFRMAYTDVGDMIKEAKPDCLLLAVPVEKTAALAMETAGFGIPMMVEKPPALTAEEAKKLTDCFERHGILHQVAFNRHFIPVTVSLKKKLEKETLRNIQIQMCRVRRTEATFYTTAIHDIDLLRYLAGAPYQSVDFAYQDLPEYGEHVSNFYLQCRFQNGITGQLTILTDSGIVNERVFASCKDAAFYANLPVWECSDSPGGIVTYRQDRLLEKERGPAVGSPLQNAVASGFYGEIEHFIQAVEEGKQPSESMEYATSLVMIAEKLHKREREYRVW